MNAADAPCKSAGVNTEITNCMFNAWKTADAELNRVYAQSRQRLEGEDLQRLIVAQRLWIQFRDANCDAAYGLYGVAALGQWCARPV
ncbi:lysozyme inhibitor LprI family protein [Tunturiibacter lichenicola]|uniref:lysozyme inhibitor LprI family protein n=1 Tax=Tunturiibacter lichenicola TaxID=2051959 RepID=UPI003D9B1899